MKDYGKVSIIMPNYNCAPFVVETIRSIQAQTYTNWELLIVDDRSTDKGYQILLSEAEKDCRIKVLQNVKNSGAAVSRNYAMREASGQWIAFLDSDDLWEPEKLEHQLEFMDEHKVVFSYTNSVYVDEDGNPLNITETGPKKVGYGLLLLFNFLSTCSVMYRSDVMRVIQIADIKKRNDYAIWLKAARIAPCYLLDEDLTKYRIRTSGNLSEKSKGLLGQRSLLRDHYILFHKSEGYNPVVSALFVAYNLIGYIVKKVKYVKHS